MSSIPTLNSPTVADSALTRTRQITPTATELPSVTNAGTVSGASINVRQTVQISQQALDRYLASVTSVALQLPEGSKAPNADALDPKTQADWVAGQLAAKSTAMQDASLHLSAASDQLEQTYLDVLQSIFKDNPDLQGASFGFSVNEQGTLFATNTSGLNSEQVSRLEQALNGSKELVQQANAVADAQIALFDTENFSLGVTFNRGNYGQTIDLGAELLARNAARNAPRDASGTEIHRKNLDNNWRQQLWDKGVRS